MDDDDDDDCGAVSRMNEGKPATVPLCPPQIPYGLTRNPTRAARNNFENKY
jgi:hypothetical protein